ncbi:response regulator transcription factor [Herbaspirillum sp. RV1423]|uniref:response regulator transcription factor n=1 Tax=Herbaspirillum sp. RV1423 TaxID=1443993 RepID=UPI00068402BC|nr:response regulator transcription factor [Herbaspirillum sp. RV1423]
MTPNDNPPSEADKAMVFVVDDDASMRKAVDSLLRSAGLSTQTFASTAEFMQHKAYAGPACLVLDVRLQGVSGLDFQTELQRSGDALPIIFMTGHGDIPMSVKAMKAGAIDFLAKPFRDQDLLDAVMLAIERDRANLAAGKSIADLKARFATLTAREREIMGLAASGLMNKQIAGEVGTSEITVKIHRGNAMKKMQAKSFAELVKMAQALGLSS